MYLIVGIICAIGFVNNEKDRYRLTVIFLIFARPIVLSAIIVEQYTKRKEEQEKSE